MLIFPIGSFFDLLYLNTSMASQWPNLSLSEGILLNIVILLVVHFFSYLMQLFRVLKRLYICELKNPEYLTLIYYVLHSLILYCTLCKKLLSNPHGHFDRFVLQPLFGTKLSPSPSSEGELATQKKMTVEVDAQTP